MTMPLIIRSQLFIRPSGRLRATWYDGLGDGASVTRQNEVVAELTKHGANTIALNICNEDLSSPFVGEFMNSDWHQGKCNLLVNFIKRIKGLGGNVVIAFFDGNEGTPNPGAKYPFLTFPDRIPAFLEIVTKALSPIVDGFLIGIETNRYAPIEAVEDCIDLVQQFAVRTVDGLKFNLPVGTHEQNVGRNNKDKLIMRRRVPKNADFVGFETSNHPKDGDSVPVSRMAEEVRFLVANSGGRGVWVVERNWNDSDYSRIQGAALAEIPGVIGVDGPI